MPKSTKKLFHAIDQKIAAGVSRIHLLINTPGGTVAEGIAVYNYLRGAPVEVITHNFGTVDSIGTIIFCAGEKRLCVPHARFLMHPVAANFSGELQLGEQGLQERLEGLKVDQENICRIIADTAQKPLEEVLADIRKVTTLNAQQAKTYKLVTEIRSQLHPASVDLTIID